MIDTHAHAFPAPSYHAGRLPPTPGKALARLAPALEAAGRILARPGGQPPMTVERAAKLRARGPELPLRWIETCVSLVSMPVVLTGASTIERLLDSMDRFGIETTVVIAGPPVAPNEWLLEAAAEAGDRLIPVATLPDLPRHGTSEGAWIQGFEELADGGARGFKIHNNVEGLSPEHPAYRALFEVAKARGLFVILHTGCFHVFLYKDRGPTEPAAFENLFRAYPEVRVCLAHMNRDHPERAWEVMKRHEQLYTDTSWQPAEAVRRAVEAVGRERVLLGSDWPLLHPDLQGEAVEIVRRALSDADAERVAVDNALRFLGDGRG